MPLQRKHWGVLIHLYYQVHRYISAGKQEVIRSIGNFTLIKLNRKSKSTGSSQSSLICLKLQWEVSKTDSKEVKKRFGFWFHVKYTRWASMGKSAQTFCLRTLFRGCKAAKLSRSFTSPLLHTNNPNLNSRHRSCHSSSALSRFILPR